MKKAPVDQGPFSFLQAAQEFPPRRVTSQIMIPMIKTTSKTPTHTPALKMPPTTVQLLNSVSREIPNTAGCHP